MNKLTLKVGGKIYGGWKDISVRTSIAQLAGAYELALTERWPNQAVEWQIPPGEFCEIFIGSEPVITGYVDEAAVAYDANSHEIKISGRDKTGDLVDCSAPSKSFAGQTFLQLATTLCAPFGIKVSTDVKLAGTVLPKFSVQNGETVFRTLEKMARSEGLMLVSDRKGGLLITRPGVAGTCAAALKNGENILRAAFENNHSQLYSEITVKGQTAAPAASQYTLAESAPRGGIKRTAVQSGSSQVERYRPLILVAETQANAARCQQRAEWEASNREAKSKKIGITVQAWREKENGALWQMNRMVRVICPWMRVDGLWLIEGVTYRLSEAGTTAELTLVDKAAYEILPEQTSKSGKSGGSSKSTGKYEVISE